VIKAKPNGVKTFQNFPRTAPTVRGEYLPALHLIYFIIAQRKAKNKRKQGTECRFVKRFSVFFKFFLKIFDKL
jgi:hypothetical protein